MNQAYWPFKGLGRILLPTANSVSIERLLKKLPVVLPLPS